MSSAGTPKPSPSDLERRRKFGHIAVMSVLGLWAALVVMTTVLLFKEFTKAIEPKPAATQTATKTRAAPHESAAAPAKTEPAVASPEKAGPTAAAAPKAKAEPAKTQQAAPATASAPSKTATAAAPPAAQPRAQAETAAAPQPIAVDPPWQRPAPNAVLTRIGVGSCLNEEKPQPIWNSVVASKPDLFLMVGDNVYGDIRKGDPQELATAYRVQAAQPELKRARAAFPFLAIWDDHDYGRNDAGAGFEFQPQAARYFRQFWQLPEADRFDGGIYYAKTYGPPGKRVQIIFLDTRTFRADLKKKSGSFAHWGKYEPDADPEKTMLGPVQWAWLESQLRKPADLRLIASGIQVLAEGHGWERWGNLPLQRQRFVELLRDTRARGVILLSGDRHSAAVYKTERDEKAAQPALVELTASSLNMAFGPSKDTVLPPLASRIFFRENYGLIDIDWEKRTVQLAIHGIDGRQEIALAVPFADLGLVPSLASESPPAK